jgi:hypothetical protein
MARGLLATRRRSAPRPHAEYVVGAMSRDTVVYR